MNSEQSNWIPVEDGASEKQPDAWLASLLLSRPRARERFLRIYERLYQLPRRARRRLAHKAAAGLAGAALVLAMTGAPARAANITVANGQVAINDNNKCSLREAIINANDDAATYDDCAAGSGPLDTITLPNNGNFNINNSFTDFYGPTGLPLIESAIIIEGNGSTLNRPNNAPNLRFLGVNEGANLTLRDLTLNRGKVADDDGGAIHVFYADLILHDVTIQNSRATGSGDGGAIASFWGYTRVEGDSLLTGNVAGDEGGAIYSAITQLYELGGVVVVEESTISGNEAERGGGIAMASYGEVYDDVYTDWLKLNRATISDNSAAKGGGLHLDRGYGDAIITSSTISGNSATGEGGGIYAGFPPTASVTIINSTISGNSAEHGGGIKNEEASISLLNTTVTGNSAQAEGGGLHRYGGGTISLERSIVSGNAAPVGPNTYSGGGSTINSEFTIFGHSGNAGVFNYDGPAPLDPTDIVPAQSLAQLLNTTLQNQGGFTDVHTLPSGSVALDAAPETDCAAAPVSNKDQRGQARNQNAVGANTASDCDRGAVERQPLTLNMALVAKLAGSFINFNFQPNDILANVGGSWSLFFDGQSAGLPAKAKIAAIDIPDFGGDDALMSFTAPVKVPGLGKTPANDIVLFDGSGFQKFFDGSVVGLSTAGERIDSFDVQPGTASPMGTNCLYYLQLSTTGTGSVPRPGGGVIRFAAADVLGFCLQASGATTSGQWHLALDASAEGAPDNATTSLAAAANGDLYLTSAGDFFVDTAAGRNPSLIYLWMGGRFVGPEIVPADSDVLFEIVAFDVQ